MNRQRLIAKGKVLAALSIVSVMVISGCSKGGGEAANTTEVTQETYNALLTSYTNLDLEKGDILNKYNSLKGVLEMFPEANKYIGTGTTVIMDDGSISKVEMMNKINFGEKYVDVQTSTAYDMRTIQLCDGVSVSPSKFWVIQFVDGGVELSHEDGISARIEFMESQRLEGADVVEEIIADPYIKSTGANILDRFTLLYSGSSEARCGVLYRCSVPVVDYEVISDWRKFEDRDAEANEAVDKATKLEEKATELENKVIEMTNANTAYEQAASKKKTAEKAEQMPKYTQEEITEAATVATQAREKADSFRKEADSLRAATPGKELAETYQLVFFESVLSGKQVTGYITYKDVDYQSVWESVVELIESIDMGGCKLVLGK